MPHVFDRQFLGLFEIQLDEVDHLAGAAAGAVQAPG
jgi:hypothetical protein